MTGQVNFLEKYFLLWVIISNMISLYIFLIFIIMLNIRIRHIVVYIWHSVLWMLKYSVVILLTMWWWFTNIHVYIAVLHISRQNKPITVPHFVFSWQLLCIYVGYSIKMQLSMVSFVLYIHIYHKFSLWNIKDIVCANDIRKYW
jgi:hypothetical protein